MEVIKVKIVFSTVILGTGGAERFTTTLANRFSENGNDVIIICSYIDKNFHYYVDKNVKIYEILPKEDYKKGFFHFITLIKRVRKVREILKNERPDILFTIYFNNSIQDLISSFKLSVSTIVGERDAFFLNENIIKKMIRKVLYRLFDGFVYQTEYSKQVLDKYNTKAKPSIILKNPLFINDYKDDVETCSKNEIVCAGRLDKNKNFSGIIKAFASVADKYNDYRLIIYGEGPERENLVNEIEILNLKKRVILPGITTDIVDSFSGARCFVLFSFMEGYPNVLLEAMAIGIPVIASNCPIGASEELIENGISGFIVEVDDIKDLSDKIAFILGNKSKAKEMAKKSRKVREANNLNQVSKEFFNFMEWLLVKNNGKK